MLDYNETHWLYKTNKKEQITKDAILYLWSESF